MARRPELEAFAGEHGLKIGTIADLIRYRLAEGALGRAHRRARVETEFGAFRLCCYEDHVQRHGAPRAGARRSPRRRSRRWCACTCRTRCATWSACTSRAHGWTLRGAHASASRARAAASSWCCCARTRARASIADAVRSAPGARRERRRAVRTVLRTYGIGAQILHDLGVTRMRVLSRAEADARHLGVRPRGRRVRGLSERPTIPRHGQHPHHSRAT